MTSKPVAFLLADLGVTKTHSRPYVSDDNPFSEAQFKTLKYRPDFPERFGSIEHARAHCRGFFPWYNAEHRHSGIALITPEDVHYGRTTAILEARAATLDAAFAPTPTASRAAPQHRNAPRGGLDQPARRAPTRPRRAIRATLISPAGCLK